VGFYDPAGKWQPESDHASETEAAAHTAFLNGQSDMALIYEALNLAVAQIEYDRPEFFEEDKTREGWEANLSKIKHARELANRYA